MKHFIILTILFFLSLYLSAQSIKLRESQADQKGNISFGKVKLDSLKSNIESKHILKNIHSTKESDQFKLIKKHVDDKSITHETFQQYFNGVKVEDGIYKIHFYKDEILVNGKFYLIENIPTTPSIKEKNALDAAINYFSANKYSWEEMNLLDIFPAAKESLLSPPKGELTIVENEKSRFNYSLCWKFNISSLEPIDNRLIYVDAITNDIVKDISLICDTNSPGTAETEYSGNQNIISDSFAGEFRLLEDRNNVTIHTRNALDGSSISNWAEFIDNDNNWLNVEHANNQNTFAHDAHWGVERLYDFWINFNTQRDSYDNNGGDIVSYVHFDIDGDGISDDVNARWLSSFKSMIFGDASFPLTPLTTLDIIAHEFSHGIDDHEAQLVYQGESGAIDESIADIWGAVIENWAAPGDPNKDPWLIGEEIGTVLRSMRDPNSTGDADTYGVNDPNWIDP